MTEAATFVSAVRRGDPPVATEHGRALRRPALTVHTGSHGDDEVVLPFVTPGPWEVQALRAGAIRRRVPHPGTVDADEEYRPYVELMAEDLPWRYTPGLDAQQRLRPWLVLVVGTADELDVRAGRARLRPGAQVAHRVEQDAALWAHVQRDSGAKAGVARVVCGRTLATGSVFRSDADHIAALVIPWLPDGRAAWPSPAGGDVEVPCLLSWTYRTGPPRGFRDLAEELQGADADRLGTVDVVIDAEGTTVPVAGALTTVDDATVSAPPGAFRHDLLAVETDGSRPVVGPPAYGSPWFGHREVRGIVAAAPHRDETEWTWPGQANADLRRRVVAGVGRRAGIELQEEIVASAARAWRAAPAVAAAVSALALGLAASDALWRRRLPDGAAARARLLGPATGRLLAGDGDGELTLRRALRHPRGTDRGGYAVNLLGPVLGRALVAGGPADRFARSGAADGFALVAAAGTPPRQTERPRDALDEGAPLEDLDIGHLDVLVADVEQHLGGDAAAQAIRRLQMERRIDTDVRPDGEEPQDAPLQLETLVDLLVGTLNPRGAHAPARRRVLGRIGGLDRDRPLAPLEDCPDLDLPAWRYLRDHGRQWLLPGADTLEAGEVVTLRTNPAFVEAFLLGLNQQALAELRWRQHPVRAGCTPLRRFWDRTPAGDGGRRDDILGVQHWADGGTPTGRLGAHAPGGVEPERLVVVIRSELFARYPRTLVSLAPDGRNRPAQLDRREWPEFVAALGEDLTMFAFATDPADADDRWVVVEEVPDGIRFRVHPSQAVSPTDGASYAAALFEPPLRVILSGESTIAGATT